MEHHIDAWIHFPISELGPGGRIGHVAGGIVSGVIIHAQRQRVERFQSLGAGAREGDGQVGGADSGLQLNAARSQGDHISGAARNILDGQAADGTGHLSVVLFDAQRDQRGGSGPRR